MNTPFSRRKCLKGSALAAGGLRITLPATKPCDDVFALKLAPG
jgi:hypothetical protein